MPKLIKKLMRLELDFLSNFEGFWGPKLSQVSTKIGSKLDVNLERPIFTKTYKNLWFFIDFFILGVEKPIKNRFKNDVNFGRHLGIDFD